jgi:CDP-diacylglycerol--glycerol-3-phosphate 3-phosphatidyltransferase
MSSDRWNASIVLTPTDRLFRATLMRLIPKRVRPNHITVVRMLLTPVVLYFLSVENFDVGVPLFLATALTDWCDGSLARNRKMITEWGIVYDPVADKLLIGSVLFVIVLKHINFVLGMTLLVVEAAIVIAGWLRQKRRGQVEPANIWGKRKMVAECVGIMLLLVALWAGIPLLVDVSTGTLALAIVFAIVSVFTRIQ